MSIDTWFKIAIGCWVVVLVLLLFVLAVLTMALFARNPKASIPPPPC